MKSEKVPVSYRDKEKNQNVSLGEIEVQIPETVEEAVQLFGSGDNGTVDHDKGLETLLDYATKAYIIDLQREFRDANRPDTVSYTHLRAHETPEHLVCRLLLEK